MIRHAAPFRGRNIGHRTRDSPARTTACARLSIATSTAILYYIHWTTALGLSWERVLLYHRLTRELSTGLGSCSTQAYLELGVAERPQISENRAQMDGDDVFWFVDGVFEEPEDDEDGPEADEILLSWS